MEEENNTRDAVFIAAKYYNQYQRLNERRERMGDDLLNNLYLPRIETNRRIIELVNDYYNNNKIRLTRNDINDNLIYHHYNNILNYLDNNIDGDIIQLTNILTNTRLNIFSQCDLIANINIRNNNNNNVIRPAFIAIRTGDEQGLYETEDDQYALAYSIYAEQYNINNNTNINDIVIILSAKGMQSMADAICMKTDDYSDILESDNFLRLVD